MNGVLVSDKGRSVSIAEFGLFRQDLEFSQAKCQVRKCALDLKCAL